jgi:hypothetical protein
MLAKLSEAIKELENEIIDNEDELKLYKLSDAIDYKIEHIRKLELALKHLKRAYKTYSSLYSY